MSTQTEAPEPTERASLLDAQGDGNEWLQFLLKDQHYALSVSEVQEILCAGDITPVPGAESHVLGVINVRGTIVTVVDARKRLEIAGDDDRKVDWTIILDVKGHDVGLLVDDVHEVLIVDEERVEKVPTESSEFVYGVVESERGMTTLLDAKRLILGSAAAADEENAHAAA
jgi:purine-binding chemotaxis protein CheW